MDRRSFLAKSAILGVSLLPGISSSALAAGRRGNVRMLTSGGPNHFFGYYGINPWNAKKTHLLSLEVPFNHRLPEPGEKAVIGLVDMKTGKFSRVAETDAWNLQQGCMLHWNPKNPGDEFYYNDVVDGKLVSVLLNINTGKKSVIEHTLSGISHNGKSGVHMDYGRISRLRKVVSYSGTSDKNADVAHPENDGVFIVDLQTGKKRLLVSYKQMADDILQYEPLLKDRHMWVEHADISRDDNRVMFLPRSWNADGSVLETGLYTIAMDGTDMRRVLPYGSSMSHFGWRNGREIAATFNYKSNSRSHVLFNDVEKDNNFQQLTPFMWDGHCSFSKDGKWLLTDGNKDYKKFTNGVWIYNMEKKEPVELATMQLTKERFLKGDARCDLHPRFSDDNSMICVDAIDPATGNRQIFIIETGI